MKTNKLKFLLLGLISLSIISCNDFLDVNDDPNNLLQEKITPALLLPGAMNNAHRVQSRAMNNLGNIWMQNWGGDVNNFTNANVNDYSLQLSNNYNNGIWDGIYPAVANFQAILDFPSETNDNHKAVAYIMKSYYMQYIVDIYGDAPYSQAFKGQANLSPKYDDDKDIYRDLIVSIDKGIDKFYAADPQDVLLGTSDVMLAGNVLNWVRFANTLKMKILLRQATLAQTDPATQTYVQAEFAKIVASGVGFSTANVTINPGYGASENPAQNPFFSLFTDSAGNPTGTNNFTRATDYIAGILNGTNTKTTGLVDPRSSRLYVLQSGIVQGAVQGANIGPDPMSAIGPGLLIGSTQVGYVMTFAEINFMLSEAKLKNYLTGGLPGALVNFNAGVTASFTLLGATGASAYLASANTKPGLGWGATTNKLEAIMTQKWLATNGINAMESYIDQVRTGFPVIPLATTAEFPNRPYRLLYPTSELVANSANVPNVTLSQIFTQGPFWKN